MESDPPISFRNSLSEIWFGPGCPGRETLAAKASACSTAVKLGASFLPSPLSQLITAAQVPLARTSINLCHHFLFFLASSTLSPRYCLPHSRQLVKGSEKLAKAPLASQNLRDMVMSAL